MKIDIDSYIQESAKMENTSAGGAASYHFGDVVLIYYEDGRDDAEQVAELANALNAKGVRTPRHLAMKREIVTKTYKGESYKSSICWVLQSAAGGVPMTEYCNNEDRAVQLEMQSRLANAPDNHYEQYARDLQALFNVGIEPKSKNLFYDDSVQNGGFTVIDLMYDGDDIPPFNPDSVSDVLGLYKLMQNLANQSGMGLYRHDKIATDEQKAISRQHYMKIKQKVFHAIEKTVPNFEKHRRYVLRSIPREEQEYFAQNGTEVGDLTLNEQEQNQFKKTATDIVESSVVEIEKGEKEYLSVERFGLSNDLNHGMRDSWRYHPQNKLRKQGREDEFDFQDDSSQMLIGSLRERIETILEAKSKDTTNPCLIKAMEDLQKKRIQREQAAQRKNTMTGKDL